MRVQHLLLLGVLNLNAFSRLSLTAKVAVVIIGANAAALAVTTWLSWSADLAASMGRAETEWTQATRQIGVTTEGAVKWKKAAVIQEAYKMYRDNPALGLRSFVALNGKGEPADSWADKTGDTGLAQTRIKSLIDGKPEQAVLDSSIPGQVLVVSPLGLDKKGARIGYVATAWSTEKVISASRLQAGFFAGKQALVIAFVIAAFFFAMRQFAGRPLAALATRITRIREGDLDAPVPHSTRGDAIGVIARALTGSIESIRETTRQEHIARQQQVAMDGERSRFAEQARLAAEKQAEAIAALGASLERVAAGDFSVRLGNIDMDFENLRSDFNKMVAAVADTLAGISHTASALDGGAVDLAGSADQLARRTETQAAALEETAAALDEITSTVGLSTKKADEASQLVAAAKQSAHGSAAIVREAISAMDRIQESSSQIGKIIGVIDEIAFQTNLLALNAGVEAARAGEAGKGFAVVAQEVRALAQRSAGAAKEIKQLVSNSGREVGAGVSLVNNMGGSLLTIEQQIREIDGSIAIIVASAREQSHALGEVNGAIRRMDHNTQQNAAMVEETNAACQELQSQSNQLKAALGNFSFDGGHSPLAHAPAHHAGQVHATAPVTPRRAVGAPIRRPATASAAAAVASDWQEF
ncbi:MAG: Methyl-accepting chemotaxis protein [Rhizobium sp.]|nr:Methyl-accepting chemotaxis protein [Rhizobium sp.]